MGELFGRYFSLLAGRLYGVIATPPDEPDEVTRDAETGYAGCLCPPE